MNHRIIVGSMPHPLFDNAQAYPMGSVVTYYGQYWQANRDVSPPTFPSFMSGDVPGESDAWRSMTAGEVVTNVIGATVPENATPRWQPLAIGVGILGFSALLWLVGGHLENSKRSTR